MADTNLYPPVIETTMPAFIRTDMCKVYFSISTYNSISDIANAQVTVRYQNTNTSALSSSSYPSGIKIATVYEDSDVTDDAKYYVEIDAGDLSSGIFELNQYYKVQIRFTSTAAASVSGSTGIASWLTNNQDYFSEWSTVCLIRGIAQPYFTFTKFSDGTTTFDTQFLTVSGSMYFSDTSEKDYLTSYRITILSGDTTIVDSGIQYTEDYNPNEINYPISYMFTNGSYNLYIEYTTYCGYTNTIYYGFTINVSTSGETVAEFTITPDEENGRNIVAIEGIFYGNVILKRASSEDNFTVWETLDDSVTIEESSSSTSSSGMSVYVSGSNLVISGASSVATSSVTSALGYTHTTVVVNGDIMSSSTDDTLTLGISITYTFYDYTIESGVWYQYAVQLLNDGEYSAVATSDKMINVLDDIFLTRADIQLRVRFDPGISSFKRTYSEALTETIGSQYPYIRRNGAINYRQFPISGLITGFCDGEGIFINEDTLYGDNASDYAYYNEKMQIKKSNDFIYERKFREKIMDFLYANDVKLFRSTTEGNILVRLMDISFTPKSELGRMIYDFSATAYEIDDCTVENYQNYGIL